MQKVKEVRRYKLEIEATAGQKTELRQQALNAADKEVCVLFLVVYAWCNDVRHFLKSWLIWWG